MKLYHASNMVVREPVIMNRFATLDFGTGFYTTTNADPAAEFAVKVYRRRGRKGRPIVNIYEFDEVAARAVLSILEFEGPDKEWLEFIVHNRRLGRDPACEADIIIGPVANDDVFETITLYEAGQIDAESALKRFKVKALFNQVLFCNMESLAFLAFETSMEIEGL